MKNNHYDIKIPKILTKLFNKEFTIVHEEPFEFKENPFELSIDFPRKINKPDKDCIERVVLNGNLSEIARNYYGNHNNITPEKLTTLYGYGGSKFVCKEFEKWFQESNPVFSEKGYNVLDMFYWEEKMGNWASKAKTEMSALGIIIYSPFCSHKLLKMLLSSPRKYRDKYSNKLYDTIFKKLRPDMIRIPINPSPKKSFILLLKKLNLANPIQTIILNINTYRSFGSQV